MPSRLFGSGSAMCNLTEVAQSLNLFPCTISYPAPSATPYFYPVFCLATRGAINEHSQHTRIFHQQPLTASSTDIYCTPSARSCPPHCHSTILRLPIHTSSCQALLATVVRIGRSTLAEYLSTEVAEGQLDYQRRLVTSDRVTVTCD